MGVHWHLREGVVVDQPDEVLSKLGLCELTYIDGRCRLINKHQVTGAGVFAPQELHVHPGGGGESTGLSWLASWWQRAHVHCHTVDSLALIYQFEKAVHAPKQVRTH